MAVLKPWQSLTLFWCAVLSIRLIAAGHLGLHADEAYYWTWSQDLSWGYFDHPPAIAGWIGASVAVFGHSELGVRALGILLHTAAMGAFVWAFLSQEDDGDPWLLTLLLCMPLFFMGGLVATPDAPLLTAWTVALIAAKREWWWVLGIACGAAMLSKLTGYLLLPAVILAVPHAWKGLARASLVSFLVVLPTWVWNFQHDWINFRYQINHGVGGGFVGLSGVAEGLVGQAGVIGPFTLVAAFIWWRRSRRTHSILWWSSVLPLAAFLLASLTSPPEVNWMAPAWIGIAWGLAASKDRLRRLSWLGASTGFFISLIFMVHAFLPLWTMPKDPLDRLRMGPQLADRIAAWGVEPVVCQRYQEAAWLAFYTGLETTTLPDFSRRDQYDLWPRPDMNEALYLRPSSNSSLEAEESWERVWDGTRFPATYKKRIIASWQVYRVANWGYNPE
jgi:4-amino-4-deoxy-L-arabinose transferase-like glycosyltransferase